MESVRHNQNNVSQQVPNEGVTELWESLFIEKEKGTGGPAYNERKEQIETSLPEPPIIIGGCGRSGTTVLHSILAAHPEVYAIPAETTVFCPTAYGELQRPVDLSEIDYNADFDLYTFYEKCFNEDIPSENRRWAEKTPRNVLFFERILEHFGESVRIVHVVRDGRDVILSRHPTNPQRFWVEPERWIEEVSAGLAFRGHPQVFTLRYEDLVLDFDATIKELCKFAGLSVVQEILEWHTYTEHRQDPSWEGGIKPLHPDSIGKYKKSEHGERVNTLLQKEKAREILKKLDYSI